MPRRPNPIFYIAPDSHMPASAPHTHAWAVSRALRLSSTLPPKRGMLRLLPGELKRVAPSARLPPLPQRRAKHGRPNSKLPLCAASWACQLPRQQRFLQAPMNKSSFKQHFENKCAISRARLPCSAAGLVQHGVPGRSGMRGLAGQSYGPGFSAPFERPFCVL